MAKEETKDQKNKNSKFAVVETGGKQYLVYEGDKLKVEKLADKKEGDTVTFDQVLLTADDKVNVGTPLVDGAKIEAKVLEEGKDKKIDVLKFKAKSRYHKRYGHRQPYTMVEITKI